MAATTKRKSGFTANRENLTVQDYFSDYVRRIRAGDIGSLPIIIGLVIIAILFQSLNSNYLTPRNFVNLIVQMAGITTIAYGIVFVLLLGEIDLSVSYVSAIAGVTMVVLMTNGLQLPGVAEPIVFAWYTAIPFCLAIAALIGLVQGIIITTLDLPALIVTLAGFLVWNGVMLLILGDGGTLRIADPVITGIANSFLTDWQGWLFGIVGVGAYAGIELWTIRYRTNQGLSTKPYGIVALQVGALAIFAGVVVFIANQDRGVPSIGITLLVMMVVLTFLAKRTPFGRYVYAVGGNPESVRRAGISVSRIRTLVFTLAAFMAGIGGIVLVSRLRSVSANAGGGDLLLNSIAAAVIGGTSLFGGRGFVGSAFLGALVIASVDSGMGLLGYSSGNRFVVTGVVLLIAVVVDALSRRRQKQAGIV